MATVFLATDLKHNRKVALKVLRPEIAASLGSARFLREIQIAAGLVHPHILGLHDSGEIDGQLFYVMPYVEGESLRERLTREGRVSLPDTVRIVGEVADGLTHAHARGILHRDIKPENILFEAGHAIVTDFGVARALTAAGDETVTQTGVAVGTPAYMSPEQAVGDKQLDARCDVYSLGCVAFEMLSGERPFGTASAHAVLARKMLGTPASLRDVAPDVPEAVEHVVTRALAPDPVGRYASATEFAVALQEAASGLTVRTPAPTPRRRPVRIFLAVAAATVVVLAAAFLAPRWMREPPIRSLAVLPFSSAGADSLQQYVVDGIQDEIIGELGKITALRRVISRTSVMRYRNTTRSIPEIARDLHVDGVVEAALYRLGDSVRIQLRLVRAVPDERQVWSHTYDTDARNLRTLHAEVARGIVDELRVALTPQEQGRLATANRSAQNSTTNREAYDAFLLGKYSLNKRTADGIANAESQLRHAIALDPNFAAAHAALASALALVNDWHYKPIDPIAVSREAIVEANRALALDSLSGDAWAARGRVLSAAHAPEELVRRDFERAIRAVPHHANAHGWYAMELARRGHRAESRAQNDTSIALDPTAPGRHNGFAISAENIGDFEVALAESRRVTQLEPSLNTARYLEGIALLALNRIPECLSVPLDRYPSVRAICLHAQGQVDEARRLIDSVVVRTNQAIKRGSPFADILIGDNLALYYAYAADADEALRWTRFAGTLTTATPTSLVYGSPIFDRIRHDPRFVAGIQEINDDIWRRINTPPLKLD